ncbi:MAG: hypothetical protein WC873_02740 [Candidatus Gracilibacteria bacterium]
MEIGGVNDHKAKKEKPTPLNEIAFQGKAALIIHAFDPQVHQMVRTICEHFLKAAKVKNHKDGTACVKSKKSPQRIEISPDRDRISFINEKREETATNVRRIIETVSLLKSGDVEADITVETRITLLRWLISMIPLVTTEKKSHFTHFHGNSAPNSFGRDKNGEVNATESDPHVSNPHFHPKFIGHNTFRPDTPDHVKTRASLFNGIHFSIGKGFTLKSYLAEFFKNSKAKGA